MARVEENNSTIDLVNSYRQPNAMPSPFSEHGMSSISDSISVISDVDNGNARPPSDSAETFERVVTMMHDWQRHQQREQRDYFERLEERQRNYFNQRDREQRKHDKRRDREQRKNDKRRDREQREYYDQREREAQERRQRDEELQQVSIEQIIRGHFQQVPGNVLNKFIL